MAIIVTGYESEVYIFAKYESEVKQFEFPFKKYGDHIFHMATLF